MFALVCNSEGRKKGVFGGSKERGGGRGALVGGSKTHYKESNGNSVLHFLFYLHSFTFAMLPTSCSVSLQKNVSDLVLTS